MSIIPTLKKIAELSREKILDRAKRSDTCLPTCMVVAEILRALSIDHKLVPCKCNVTNAKMGDDYYGVGITNHMIVVVANAFIIDPSIDQASRPGHDINLTPMVKEMVLVEEQMAQIEGMKIAHCACSLTYAAAEPWHLNAPDFTLEWVKDIIVDDAQWVVDQLKADGLVKDRAQ